MRKVRQDRMMCEITLEISPDSLGSHKGTLILILAKHPIIVRDKIFIYYPSQTRLLCSGQATGVDCQSRLTINRMPLLRSVRKGTEQKEDPPKKMPPSRPPPVPLWRDTCLLLTSWVCNIRAKYLYLIQGKERSLSFSNQAALRS